MSQRVRLLAVATVLCALTVGSGLSVAQDGADKRRRGPRCSTGKTLLRSDEARILKAGTTVAGCVRGQRRSWYLATDDFYGCYPEVCSPLLRPTLAGHWLAYVYETGEGREGAGRYTDIRIIVVDLLTANARKAERSVVAGINIAGERTPDDGSWTGRGSVEGLVVSRRGSVAFVVKDLITPAVGYRVYRAERPFARAFGQPPVELAASRRIQPRTLRLRGDRVSWVQAGTRRSARLR